MAITVKHNKVSTVPDGDDTSVVRPSDWNADHTLVGTIDVANGGTGASTASAGLNNLLPSQTGNNGKVLSTDGTNASWSTNGSGDVVGPASATDNAVARFDQTTGKLIQNSVVTMDDTGVIAGATLTSPKINEILDANGNEVLGLLSTASATDYVGIKNGIGVGVPLHISSEGSSTNIGLHIQPKGSGLVTISDGTDFNKGIRFRSSGSAASAVTLLDAVSTSGRVITLPDATTTLVGRDTTDTLTNKTLTNPVISGGTINGTTIGATTPSSIVGTTITGQTGVLRGTGQNLLLQSQDAVSWTPNQTTVTANSTTAPDGTTTADTLTEDTTTNFHRIQPSSISIVSGLQYTFSVFVKNGDRNFTQLFFPSQFSTADFANFNISTGVLGTVGGGATATITSFGNGWYRCSVTATATSSGTGSLSIGLITSSTSARAESYLGTSKFVYLWGAQFELGSTANTYIPTTTTAVYGTPTLSFSGVSTLGLESNGALFLQPAGTGAIQAQATTSTTAGGNVRGANAVDWQTSRTNAAFVASGSQSTVGGGASNRATSTFGTASGGNNNNSSGFGAVIAGGNTNISSGAYSFVGAGEGNVASNYPSAVVAGSSNTAAGNFNFIGGGFTNSGTSGSAVTTQSGTMNATTAVTLSGSNANIKVGQYITGTSISGDTYVAAISGTSLTLSKNASGSSTSTLSFFTPHGVVVGGGNNQATGAYSAILGGGDAGTAANRNTASGAWSVVCGGVKNTASGISSFVGGGGTDGTNVFANTASGTLSVLCGGWNSTASGTLSFIGGGTSHTASGGQSVVAGGQGNTASGLGSSVLGGYNNTANSTVGAVIGGRNGTSRSITGNISLSGSNNPIADALGVSQSALLILARQTTDATATALASDTSAAGTTNQVILPNNSAYLFKATVISGVTGGGNTSGWKLEGVIKRGANPASTTIVGSVTTTLLAQDAGASGWVIAATADTTNGGLRITFTGQASTTIRTVCKVETTEVTY